MGEFRSLNRDRMESFREEKKNKKYIRGRKGEERK